MITYIFHRLFTLIPVAIGVVCLVSMLAHFVPGDPIDSLVGEYASENDKAELRAKLGLDRPLVSQLVDYFVRLSRFDMGSSLVKGRPVTELLGERIQATAELAFLAVFVAICISVPLGVLSAVFAGRAVDYVAMTVALLGIATPNFWLGSMLILLFSIELDWLPVSERIGWQSYLLPAFTMGFGLAAILSRMTRNAMLDILKEDFIRTARAKGVPEFVVIMKHALRNAALPLVTIIGLQFGVVLTGAVITEVIFDWPGLGTLMLEAVRGRDYPLIQGCVLFFSATYLGVNLMTDVIYGWVDPRIQEATKS